MPEEIKDFPGEISDVHVSTRDASQLAYMMYWLGQQCALVKDGKKDVAQANAKQMIPMFSGPMEEEILKFFIFDGGGGNGQGQGQGQSQGQSQGQGQSPAQGQPDKGKGGEGQAGGSGASKDCPASEVPPDGEYEVSCLLSFVNLGLPENSPHRKRWTYPASGTMTQEETFNYLSSAYGLPFKCKIYGGNHSFESK